MTLLEKLTQMELTLDEEIVNRESSTNTITNDEREEEIYQRILTLDGMMLDLIELLKE